MSNNRNRVIGGFEELVEQGQSTVSKATKQTITDFASSTKGQITGSTGQNSASQSGQQGGDHGTNESTPGATTQNNGMPQKTDEDRVKFLKDLYGKSDMKNDDNNSSSTQKNAGPVTQALGIPQHDPNAGKTPEEVAKIQALRNQLHADYYQNLVNRPKPKEEPVAEKLEKEKQMEELELQKKEQEKPGPLQNVKTGTGETMVGASG